MTKKNPIPNYIEPLVGYRAWCYYDYGDYITSIFYHGCKWNPGEILRSVDHNRNTAAPITPPKTGNIGVYAFKNLDELLYSIKSEEVLPYIRDISNKLILVLGRVNLWGTVHRHEFGYRAEFGYPRQFDYTLNYYQDKSFLHDLNRKFNLKEDPLCESENIKIQSWSNPSNYQMGYFSLRQPRVWIVPLRPSGRIYPKSWMIKNWS